MSKIVDELKARLAKLKDSELKLEADLAIKVHPALEDAIIELIVAAGDVKRIKSARALVTLSAPGAGKEASDQIVAHQRMISFYEGKIATLKAMITALAGSDGSKYGELVGQETRARDIVFGAVETHKDLFASAGVNMFDLLPVVKDSLPQKD